jgi:hypothetical protein
MKCPRCKSKKTEVYDSRKTDKYDGSTYRRRICNSCYHSWTTYEIQQNYLDTMVRIPVEKIETIVNELNSLKSLLGRNGHNLPADLSCDSGSDL